MVTVVNKKSHKPTSNDIFIGRGGSALGNIFTHIPSGTKALHVVATREIAIDSYRNWLQGKIETGNPQVLSALRAIFFRLQAGEDINLVCYCKPLPCHGDVIIEFLTRYESILSK